MRRWIFEVHEALAGVTSMKRRFLDAVSLTTHARSAGEALARLHFGIADSTRRYANRTAGGGLYVFGLR